MKRRVGLPDFRDNQRPVTVSPRAVKGWLIHPFTAVFMMVFISRGWEFQRFTSCKQPQPDRTLNL